MPAHPTVASCCLNVDQPKLLEPSQTKDLPSVDWLHVLATTRLGKKEMFGLHKDRAFLPVDELPEADALQLIESFQPDETFTDAAERNAALEIVRLLGGFTLAVESVAVYLGKFRNDGLTCSGFLERLKKEGLDWLDSAAGESEDGVRHGEMCLGATLLPTLERLGEAEKLALAYASFLPADQVAMPWLRALVAEQFPEMGKNAEPGYPDPWKNLLRRLLSLRLLQKTGVISDKGEVLVARIHRLVQELVLTQLTSALSESFQFKLAKVIKERTTELGLIPQRYQVSWELIPLNAIAVLWAETNHPGASWLLKQVGAFWSDLAKWVNAESIMRLGIEYTKKNLSNDVYEKAVWLKQLGAILIATNRFNEAEKILYQAAIIAENNINERPQFFADCISDFAQILKHTNRLFDAELLMRRALSIDQQYSEDSHRAISRDLNNLGQLLHATSRFEEAESIMREVLAIDKQHLGENTPDVARDLNNLALLLKATERFEEAEPLMRLAIKIDKQYFGEDHPNVASDISNLSRLLHDTNRFYEAEPMIRRALEIDEQYYGRDHSLVAIRLNNLSLLLIDLNRFDEAEDLIKMAIEIAEHILGKEHPYVAICLNTFCLLLNSINRLEESELIMKKALLILLLFTRNNAHNHPYLQRFINNYVAILEEIGCTKENILEKLQELAPEFF